MQVPFAYVAFSLFILGVSVTKGVEAQPNGIGFALSAYAVIIAVLMWKRLKLVRKVSPDDVSSRLSAVFTFLPILILTIIALLYVSGRADSWNWASLHPILTPPEVPALGFPLIGLLALLVANSIWQFADISSLQRLQSLGDDAHVSDDKPDPPAIPILRAMGIETGLGWALIIVAAVVLRTAGLSGDSFVNELAQSHVTSWLVPLFVFSVFVYMLSTISGFISALSYISFYDIVPIIMGKRKEIKDGESMDSADDVRHPRLTTITVMAFIMLFYTVLKFGVPNEQIPSVLYAIYSFQIVILPSAAMAVLFRRKLSVAPVVLSVLAGIVAAYFTAANPLGVAVQSRLGIDDISWQVMPPLITTLIAAGVFALTSSAIWLVGGRGSPRKAKT